MSCFPPLPTAKDGAPSVIWIYFAEKWGTPSDRRTNRVEKCSDSSVHPSERRGASPQVLRTENRIETQRRVRGRCDLRMWQGLLGLHVPVSGSGHVEGQHGILGGGRRHGRSR